MIECVQFADGKPERIANSVMPGLVLACPGHPRLTNFLCFRKAWMAGTSLDKPGHDEELVETDLLPAQLADEIQHRVGEAVIAVARHHVAGSGDVDGLGVRHH